MMNVNHTHLGFSIVEELDGGGKSTGVFKVISKRGTVMQTITSLLEAKSWIDAYVEEQEEEVRKQRARSLERGGR